MRSFLLSMIGLLSVAAIAAAELPSANKATIKQAMASGQPVIIDLGARSCIPCKQMAPILEELAKEYAGQAQVLFIDVHEDQDAGERFRIQMIPTQIFFNAQGKEVKRHIGFMDKAEILQGLKVAGLK